MRARALGCKNLASKQGANRESCYRCWRRRRPIINLLPWPRWESKYEKSKLIVRA